VNIVNDGQFGACATRKDERGKSMVASMKRMMEANNDAKQ
jgi:hypothetical protein